MYLIKLPPDLMAELWKLRELYNRGSIAQQVREAVALYLKKEARILAKERRG